MKIIQLFLFLKTNCLHDLTGLISTCFQHHFQDTLLCSQGSSYAVFSVLRYATLFPTAGPLPRMLSVLRTLLPHPSHGQLFLTLWVSAGMSPPVRDYPSSLYQKEVPPILLSPSCLSIPLITFISTHTRVLFFIYSFVSLLSCVGVYLFGQNGSGMRARITSVLFIIDSPVLSTVPGPQQVHKYFLMIKLIYQKIQLLFLCTIVTAVSVYFGM